MKAIADLKAGAMPEQPKVTAAQEENWMPRIETSVCAKCGKSIPLGSDGNVCGHEPCEPKVTAESRLLKWAAELVRAVACAELANDVDRDIAEPVRRIALEMKEAASSSVSAQDEAWAHHVEGEERYLKSGVSAARLRARIEALEAELAEEHRASLEDPCEQRAERYAMEAAELSKRLTAICREVEALPRWFPSELGSMAQTIDGRWLRREDVLAILRQGEGER